MVKIARAFLCSALPMVLLAMAGSGDREKPVEVDLGKREDIGYSEDPNAVTAAAPSPGSSNVTARRISGAR